MSIHPHAEPRIFHKARHWYFLNDVSKATGIASLDFSIVLDFSGHSYVVILNVNASDRANDCENDYPNDGCGDFGARDGCDDHGNGSEIVSCCRSASDDLCGRASENVSHVDQRDDPEQHIHQKSLLRDNPS